MSDKGLQALSLQELRDHLLAAEARKATAVAEITTLQEELSFRLAPEAAPLFLAAGKEAGDVTFTAHGGLKFKASISKTVKWDEAKLQQIAAGMEWSAVQRIFDIKFSVPERTFNALTDDTLRNAIEDARTVKLGELKITPVTDKKD